MSLMDAFEVGRKMKGKGAGNIMAEGVMEDFQTQNKYKQLLGLEQAKSQIISPVDQSTIAKNYALADRASGGGTARKIFLVNRRTGKIHQAGDQTMAEVDPSTVSQTDRIMGVDIPSASATNMFNQSEASTKQIDELINYLTPEKGKQLGKFQQFVGGINKKSLRPVQGLADVNTQSYGVIRNDFADRLMRLRSGAQINEQEFQRLMGLLPQWWRNDEADVKQLKTFRDEYQNLMARLSGGSLGEVNNRADISDDQSNSDDISNLSDEELDALEKQMGG